MLKEVKPFHRPPSLLRLQDASHGGMEGVHACGAGQHGAGEGGDDAHAAAAAAAAAGLRPEQSGPSREAGDEEVQVACRDLERVMGELPPHAAARLRLFMGVTTNANVTLETALDTDNAYTKAQVDNMMQRIEDARTGYVRASDVEDEVRARAGQEFLLDEMREQDLAAVVIQRAFRTFRSRCAVKGWPSETDPHIAHRRLRAKARYLENVLAGLPGGLTYNNSPSFRAELALMRSEAMTAAEAVVTQFEEAALQRAEQGVLRTPESGASAGYQLADREYRVLMLGKDYVEGEERKQQREEEKRRKAEAAAAVAARTPLDKARLAMAAMQPASAAAGVARSKPALSRPRVVRARDAEEAAAREDAFARAGMASGEDMIRRAVVGGDSSLLEEIARASNEGDLQAVIKGHVGRMVDAKLKERERLEREEEERRQREAEASSSAASLHMVDKATEALGGQADLAKMGTLEESLYGPGDRGMEEVEGAQVAEGGEDGGGEREGGLGEGSEPTVGEEQGKVATKKERIEAERMERMRADRERTERERLEREWAEKQQADRDRMEREWLESARREKDRRERDRREREQRQREAWERDRVERERRERERREQDRVEGERRAREWEKLGRLERERSERCDARMVDEVVAGNAWWGDATPCSTPEATRPATPASPTGASGGGGHALRMQSPAASASSMRLRSARAGRGPSPSLSSGALEWPPMVVAAAAATPSPLPGPGADGSGAGGGTPYCSAAGSTAGIGVRRQQHQPSKLHSQHSSAAEAAEVLAWGTVPLPSPPESPRTSSPHTSWPHASSHNAHHHRMHTSLSTPSVSLRPAHPALHHTHSSHTSCSPTPSPIPSPHTHAVDRRQTAPSPGLPVAPPTPSQDPDLSRVASVNRHTLGTRSGMGPEIDSSDCSAVGQEQDLRVQVPGHSSWVLDIALQQQVTLQLRGSHGSGGRSLGSPGSVGPSGRSATGHGQASAATAAVAAPPSPRQRHSVPLPTAYPYDAAPPTSPRAGGTALQPTPLAFALSEQPGGVCSPRASPSSSSAGLSLRPGTAAAIGSGRSSPQLSLRPSTAAAAATAGYGAPPSPTSRSGATGWFSLALTGLAAQRVASPASPGPRVQAQASPAWSAHAAPSPPASPVGGTRPSPSGVSRHHPQGPPSAQSQPPPALGHAASLTRPGAPPLQHQHAAQRGYMHVVEGAQALMRPVSGERRIGSSPSTVRDVASARGAGGASGAAVRRAEREASLWCDFVGYSLS